MGDDISYSFGKNLNEIKPYFYFEYTKKQLDELTIDFAKNVAYLREPKNPKIVIGVFYEKAKEIVPVVHGILRNLFVE